MNLNKFLDDLKEAITELPKDILDVYSEFSLDAAQVIKTRITETGRNAQGTSLADIKDYTPEYKRRKAGLTVKKIKNASNKVGRDLQSGKELNPTTLNKSIGVGGRYRGFVDATLTGAMMNNIQTHTKIVDQTGVVVSLGPTSEDNKRKMRSFVALRGEIIDLSKSETDSLTDNLEQNLQEKFNSHFV